MSHLQNSDVAEVSGYPISNSLRFQSASSQYLSRTPASATNQTTWTWSAWVKRGSLGTLQQLFGRAVGSGTELQILFNGDVLSFYQTLSNAVQGIRTTTQVFRDPSAWYHIVCVWDTSNATALDRMKIYVNGVQVTAFATPTNPTLNLASYVNAVGVHSIGADYVSAGNIIYYLDGYLTEVNFIDGQALTPSSFGETNTLTGQWVAKKYTGTYGTNGFYLPFSNGTSTTTLGADSSGNSNNWTLNNFTRSAGVSDCWMYDVPSGNGSAGTQPNSNYAVLNPLATTASNPTYSKANLTVSTPVANGGNAYGTIALPSSGKYYWEYIHTSGNAGDVMFGVSAYSPSQNYVWQNANSLFYYGFDGNKWTNGSATAYGATYTLNDVIGIAVDIDASAVTFYKNNVSQGSISFNASGLFPAMSDASGSAGAVLNINFGQRSFAYTPPTGYKALCTANLPAATIKKGNQYMDATLYTGNASTNTIVNAAGFSPDIVWGKSRSTADFHVIANSVVGANKYLFTNSTSAEGSLTDVITSFNSNGFTLGANQTINVNGASSVAWQWDAGSSTVTNTNGTISSQVRANPTAGVSVVTWSAQATAGTVGHGLGVAPKMIITKTRATTFDWFTYHVSVGAGKYMLLNSTAAATTNATVFSTSPTSTVFDAGTGNTTGNGYGAQVAYCFSEISGFSKAFSYTGNGSADGVFSYLGFTPKLILLKRTDTTGNWIMWDTVRNTYNVLGAELYPNLSNAEATATDLDVLSNGFKIRNTTAAFNASGGTYIGFAWATNPFANSNAV